MSLSRTDVEKIAHLARLALDDKEADAYSDSLTRILDLVEQMNAVDTDAVEPLAHPGDRSLRLRADEVTEVDQREAFQEGAPSVENGLYLVPKVIE